MPRDLDRAALHATFDVLLQALAKPQPSAASRGDETAPPDALVAAYQNAKSSLRDMATRDPLDALVSVVGVGTLLFYLAEKGKNEKCVNLWDALNFITTSLSVGYDDVYAKTSAGKAIAAFVMTVGPSFSARAFDAPKADLERGAAETAAMQRAVVERLDAILEALRAPSATAPARP